MSEASAANGQTGIPSLVQAVSTSAFINSLGVNTDLTWLNSAFYAAGVSVLAELQYLGVHNVRDGANDVFPATQAEDEMLMAHGIKFDLGGDMPLAQEMSDLNALEQADPGGIIAVEGLNESTVPDLTATESYQQDLYNAVSSDPLLVGVKVYNYTVGSFDASAYTVVPNQSSAATTGNAHSYSGYFPPYLWNSWYVGRNYSGTAGLPGVVTETGYNTADTIAPGANKSDGVSEGVQAKYDLDTIFDMFQMGVQTTYLYELMDAFSDPTNTVGEDAFGLFNADGTPKEAAVALHNLTTILGDTGPNAVTFTTGHLSYSVEGLNSNLPVAQAEAYFGYGILDGQSVQADFPVYGNSMLLEKSNGTYDIAVWQEPEIWDIVTNTEIVAPITPVTITLGQAAASVEVYDPLVSSSPIEILTNVSQIVVGVSDHPMIVEVDPFAPISAMSQQAVVQSTDVVEAAPFSAASILDSNAGQAETACVTLSNAADGTLTDPNAVTDGSSCVNGVLTISGSAASVEAALDGLVFTPSAHQVAPGQSVATTITAAIMDTAGQAAAITSTVIATAAAAPITASQGLASVNTTDTSHADPFSAVTISDLNAGQAETARVTLSKAANGTLTDPNAATDGSSSVNGVLIISGSAAGVEAALDGLVFTPTAHQVAPHQSVATAITAAIMDTAGQTAAINSTVIVTAVAAPITVSRGSASVSTTDASHADPFSAVTISDPNAGQMETARVTLSNAANGTLTDPNAATDGSSSANGMLTISGSAASVEAALDGLVFTPTAHQVAPGQSVATTITAVIMDTARQTAAISSTVRAADVAAPIIISTGSASVTTTDGSHADPFSAVTISDPNAGQVETASVLLSNAADGTLIDPNAATDGSSSVNGVLTIAGSAASVETALDGLVFTPTAHQVAPGQSVATTIIATVIDTARQTAAVSSTVNATAVAAPITASRGSANLSTTDGSHADPFSAVTISDPNAGQVETASVLLSNAADGTLIDPNAATDGSSSVNGVLTIAGSAASVEAALDGLVFTPTAHQVAPGQSVATTIIATVIDTARQTAAVSSTVNATAVAVPITTSQLSASVSTTDASHADPFSAVTISDLNAGQAETARVTLSKAANGTLTDPNAATDGSSSVNGVLIISGSAASVEAALDGLVFTPSAHQVAPGQSVATTITAAIMDTAGQAAAITSTVIATAVAAPITASRGSASLSTTDASHVDPFNAVTISDPNAGQAETASVSLSNAADGTLTDPNAATDGSSSVSGVLTIAGSAASVEAALDGLVFTPTAHQVAPGQSVATTITASITDTAGQTGAISSTVNAIAIAVPMTTVIGTGSDSLDLTMAERAATQGAEFEVSVDGMQIGGIQIVQSNILNSQSQVFDVLGNFATGQHTVSVTYLNASNSLLFVDSAAIDGVGIPDSDLVLSNNGSESLSFNEPASSGPVDIGSGPDTLSLFLSQRAEPTGAEFTVEVDGKQVGGVQTASANVLASQSQQIDVEGDFGPGSHTLSLDYLNAHNSLLFLDTAAINGNTISGGGLVLSNNGSSRMAFETPGSPPPVEIGSGQDILTFHASEDFSNGNAQFLITIDGKQVGGLQTATAINGNGQSQLFEVAGNFSGSHTLGLATLNGSSTLYIGGVSVDGVANSGTAVIIGSGQTNLSFTH